MQVKVNRNGYRPIVFQGDEIAKVMPEEGSYGGRVSTVFKTSGGQFVSVTSTAPLSGDDPDEDGGEDCDSRASVHKTFGDLMVALWRWKRRQDTNASLLLDRVTEWAGRPGNEPYAAELVLSVP